MNATHHMLIDVLRALKGSDPLDEMIDQFTRMLKDGKWMFEQASDALLTRTDPDALSDELYEKDRQINACEQNVREKIVTHLSLGHQADLSTCLILMSVAKDAERIGDYAKNIFEIGRFYRRDLVHPQFAPTLAEVRTDLVPMFDQVRQAFVDADGDTARGVLELAGRTTKKCDLLIRQLLGAHGTVDADEAVAYVLLARFYKRVAAHLGNIATSVVSPVSMLDYRTPAGVD